jgi:hypothetical protein
MSAKSNNKNGVVRMKEVGLAMRMEENMPERNHAQVKYGSVQAYARVGGALYLIIIIIGLLGEAVIRNSLVVAGDAAATAQRILESEFLWRLGVAGQLVLLICAVALTFIWYVLLRPVNGNIALLAIFFALISLAVESVSALHLQAVLAPLSNAALKVADPQQLHALAYLAVVSHSQAFGVALIFFGVECLIVGYLIRKSGYFPKLIGTMMQIAGLCYLINSFSLVLYPPLAHLLFPAILFPALVAEGSFCFWLLIKGVNIAAWERQTRTSLERMQRDWLVPNSAVQAIPKDTRA